MSHAAVEDRDGLGGRERCLYMVSRISWGECWGSSHQQCRVFFALELHGEEGGGTGAQPQRSDSGYLHGEEARRACQVSWSCHNCAVSHGLGLVALGLVHGGCVRESDVTWETTKPRDASPDPDGAFKSCLRRARTCQAAA
jgi:hypothetical protein